MNNLETLKQELIYQKSAIEEKGGSVTVANTNPSPSEITAGIKTIEMPDFTAATATENDVLEGKTFFSGNLTQKTGNLKQLYDNDFIKHLFIFGSEAYSTDKYYYTIPEEITETRNYLFYLNPNHVEITLPTTLKKFGDYSFGNCYNFTFTNINELTEVTEVGNYSLQGVKGINLGYLWPTLTTIGLRGLCNTIYDNNTIKLPALTSIGNYAFAQMSVRKELSSIDFSDIALTTFNSYSFMNLIVNCDFVIPSTITNVNAYAFYRGSYNNLTIPSTCKILSDYCFSGSTADPLDTYRMKTATFESEEPPTIGRNMFCTCHVTNGLKIYVPDTAVETYKAVSNLSAYVDIIYPISEKP